MNRPQVGTGIIIKKDDSILLGFREKEFGYGKLCFPGGHVELFETAENAVRRETKEECNLDIGKVTLIGFTEDFYEQERKHYITIFFLGEYIGGEPIVMEPTKVSQWRWYPISDLKNMTDQLWEQSIKKFKMLGWL